MSVLVGARSRRVSTARALGCVKLGVATSDGQRLAVREQRERVTSSLPQATGRQPSIGGGIVERAVGAGERLAAVDDDATSQQNFSRTQQRQRAIANSCVTLTIGSGPCVGRGVVELTGVTRKMVSIDQRVTVCEEHCGKAAGAEGVVHCRCFRPLPRGGIIEFGSFVCNKNLAILEQCQRRSMAIAHTAGALPRASRWVVEFGAKVR